MKTKRTVAASASALAVIGLLTVGSAEADTVRVTIENLAPTHGTFQTPAWVGFHNGTFDLYDVGAPASAALERLAEDGNVGPLAFAFAAALPGAAQGTIPGPGGPLAPGESNFLDFSLDGSNPMNRYFSYASMVIPSNDAFIANGDPLGIPIFDGTGMFIGADFIVLGSQILDAGTEVNDEIPGNTAFFGQAAPNTGVTENGVVHLHSGFLAPGSGGILDAPMFADADFHQPGYQAVRITISAVPDQGNTFSLMGVAMASGFVVFRKRFIFAARGA